MSFKVTIDGIDVFDLSRKDKTLINCKIEDKLNDASSFSFKMPPMHEFLQNGNQIQLMKSTVLVEEDGENIFAGRPSEITFDFNLDIEVYCEGQLSYFNDTIQYDFENAFKERQGLYEESPNVQKHHSSEEIKYKDENGIEFESTTIKDFLETMIKFHNYQVPKSRQFRVGKITFSDEKKIYRKLNFEKTIDDLKNMLLQAEGGYFFCRYENGINYIDYLKELTDISTQPVEFGVNMQDLNVKMNASNLYTQFYIQGKYYGVTIFDKEFEKHDYLLNSFGPITKVDNADEKWMYTDDGELNEGSTEHAMHDYAYRWLDRHKNDYLTIEATGIDLSYLNPKWQRYKMGQIVHIVSAPHDINTFYAITSMTTDLNKEQRIIKTGTETVQDLTEITKQETTSAETSGGGGGGADTNTQDTTKKKYVWEAHYPTKIERRSDGRILARYNNGEIKDVSNNVVTRGGKTVLYADRTTGNTLSRPNRLSYTLELDD